MKYLEYLEAAFLIRRIHRIDKTARRFERATTFKVYLTNPSMRAALFGPVDARSAAIGNLTETAIYSQWFHDIELNESTYYARWKEGEVDMVVCDRATQKPDWIVEVKWSDRFYSNPAELSSVLDFVEKNELDSPVVTTYSKSGIKKVRGVALRFLPSSLYCYTVGKNLIEGLLLRLGMKGTHRD